MLAMKIVKTLGKGALLLTAVVGAPPAMAEQATIANANLGCPFEISLLLTDRFVQSRIVELEGRRVPLLQEMDTLSAKASQPGTAVGDQLTPAEKEQFNRLRHDLILLQVEELKYSNFQRDVHVIAEVLAVAKLADLYDVNRAGLADADPRRFYFTILESHSSAIPSFWIEQ